MMPKPNWDYIHSYLTLLKNMTAGKRIREIFGCIAPKIDPYLVALRAHYHKDKELSPRLRDVVDRIISALELISCVGHSIDVDHGILVLGRALDQLMEARARSIYCSCDEPEWENIILKHLDTVLKYHLSLMAEVRRAQETYVAVAAAAATTEGTATPPVSGKRPRGNRAGRRVQAARRRRQQQQNRA